MPTEPNEGPPTAGSGPQPETRTSGEKPQDAHGEVPAKEQGLFAHPVLIFSIATAIVVVAVAGWLWWLHARHFESTDDAFIDAHLVRLAPQIAGRVTAVLVDDNQRVEAGQPLVVIDSADAQTRVAQAQAQRAQAQAQVANARAQIQVDLACWSRQRGHCPRRPRRPRKPQRPTPRSSRAACTSRAPATAPAATPARRARHSPAACR